MTIELNKTATSTVNKMIDSGKSFSAIVNAIVALDFAPNAKDAAEYLESRGIEKARKAGLQDKMYAYLQEAPRTQVDFYAWIKENGTENTWRWRSAHNKVRELTNRLHVTLSGVDFVENLYVEEKKEAK